MFDRRSHSAPTSGACLALALLTSACSSSAPASSALRASAPAVSHPQELWGDLMPVVSLLRAFGVAVSKMSP